MALMPVSVLRMMVAFTAMWLVCGITSPVIVSADEVSEASRYWLGRAQAEQSLALTTATASAAKAQRQERLHGQGFAGWTEWASDRNDATRDAARSAATDRFTNWLLGEIAAATDDSKGTTSTLSTPVSRLELSLPGSRAVLGWVQPDRLSGDERPYDQNYSFGGLTQGRPYTLGLDSVGTLHSPWYLPGSPGNEREFLSAW